MSDVHDTLTALLKELGLSASQPPTAAHWSRLMEALHRREVALEHERTSHGAALRRVAATGHVYRDAMVEEHETLHTVITSLSDGICQVAASGSVASYNGPAKSLLGWTDAEARMPLREVLFAAPGEDSVDAVLENVQELLHGGDRVVNKRWVLLGEGGVPFVAACTFYSSCVSEESTVARDLVLVLSDVTRSQRTEEDLLQARFDAEAANRTKSEFLANMSHEIRTPLNGVIGMIELLTDTALESIQFDYAETARTSAEALLAIINDILDFSKIEAGMYEIEQIDFNLRLVIEEVAVTFAQRAHGKKLELTYLAQQTLPERVKADPTRVRQVLNNLVSNAIKFTEQGEIVIDVSVAEHRSDGMTLRFRVSDTGIGIPADAMTRLFDAFSQVDASTTRRYGGTGLGLAISSRLVELMGGQIHVESEEGHGSTFSFTMDVGLAEGESATRTSQFKGLEVLVVDDNANSRKLLQLLLSGWGASSDVAEDGRSALEMLRQAHEMGIHYDLALIDYEMPRMSGLDLCQELRTNPNFMNVPVVLLTSVADQVSVERVEGLGLSSVLLKPVRQAHLYDCLVAALRAQPPEQQGFERGLQPTTGLTHYESSILVVESEEGALLAAQSAMIKLGYGVRLATTTSEARTLCASEPFLAVILGSSIHGVSGLEFASQLREENPRGAVFILIVDASPVPVQTVAEARRRGVDAVLSSAEVEASLAQTLRRTLLSRTMQSNSRSRSLRAIRPLSGPEKPTVLVAEDNPVNRRVAFAMLDKLGYDVELAANGKEAVELWRENTFGAVLMDCQMPEMDGYQATRAIRAIEGPEEHVPIIAMTAYTAPSDRSRALISGMDDVLTKPVKLEALAKVLGGRIKISQVEAMRAEAASAGDVFDPETVAHLVSIGQGDGLLLSLLGMFLEDLEPRLQAILYAIAQGDGESVRGLAHSLKGSAQNLGLRKLGELCVELEEPNMAWRGSTGRALATTFEQHARVVMQAVEARLQSGGGEHLRLKEASLV